MVDTVFDHQLLPLQFMRYKNKFMSQRYLSLFRTLYLSGDNRAALNYFRLAVSADLFSILKISYTRKALGALFNCVVGR